MRGYLLDENLPGRMDSPWVAAIGLPVLHATTVGVRPTDTELWEYARRHRLVIVSKDADFSDRMMLNDSPPWVVHLRVGNLRLRAFYELMLKMWPHIERHLPDHKLICVYPDRLEAFRG